MTFTKVFGSLCGSLLVYLLALWVGESLYHVGHAHHGDGEHVSGYPIEVPEVADTGVIEEGPSFEELFASADAAKGEKVFAKCKACHKVGPGENGTGPTMHQVVGRGIGGVGEYSYSEAMAGYGGEWTVEELNGFLEKPSAHMPGTKMGFNGLSKPADRANIIAYLQSLE